ncbi:hypothetical protein ACFSKN_11370 [Mariniflexile gromovii]|uniref:Phage holin family protein n=1 Tax=Mariniflexile gromovii TaxID=362523 RepID=A0ABS4BXA4_9FLAO|nr:hypothetical protein [Mariniflexile gromovii]MBP0905229.1 hypothetical protein [Mariniflexile gromovii]
MSDINPSEIMIGAIVGVIVAEIWSFMKRKYAETRPIKKLKNIKAIKVLWFSLAYILPLGTIAYLIFFKTTEPTFKNIALFIIIVATLVFNILIGHIRTLYKLNSDLIKTNTKKLTEIDQTFSKVYEHIEKTRIEK